MKSSEVHLATQIVEAITAWRNNKVEFLEHFAMIPAGSQVQAQVDGKEALLTIEGDLRTGFVLGLQLAIEQLRGMPIDGLLEPDDNTKVPPGIH